MYETYDRHVHEQFFCDKNKQSCWNVFVETAFMFGDSDKVGAS